MTLFLQCHLLTFMPPANLNRDDTGRPKTAMVGGEMRLRLSSQSLKRAWRTSESFKKALDGHLGSRTQRFGTKIIEHLIERGTKPDEAQEIATHIVQIFGKLETDPKKSPATTKQLAFLSPNEMSTAFELAEKIAAGAAKPDNIKMAQSLLKGADTAADIAMFGRMFADNAEFNREAAVQVAHAITTHRVAIEDDFYTAVDDLKKPAEDAGAGFIGEAGFGSGVFYLYLCIDTNLLLKNLGHDVELARAAVAALIEAAATVAPNGKQASFASRARASYLLVEKGSEQPRTLASAFARSVRDADVLTASIAALETGYDSFDKAYGVGDVTRLAMNVPEGKGTLAEVVAFARAFGG